MKQLSKNLMFNDNPGKVIKEAAEKKILGKNYNKIKTTEKMIQTIKRMWL